MKPLLIGEQPSKNGDPLTPLEGRIGQRLADCCGITYEQYMERFERMNLLNIRAEYSGKGMDFNVKEARKTAVGTLATKFKPGRLVLICGKRAASAFGMTSVEYFQKMVLNGADTYVIPHPSGVNRWYNDIVNELTMIRFMRSIVK